MERRRRRHLGPGETPGLRRTSMASDTVKIGFIGTGGVARWAHFGHLSKWSDVKLAAFCDVNQQACEAAAKEFGGKAYTSAEKMLDAEKLDGVYVCVPPFAHEKHEILAAQRKVAVFVEKPLTTTLEHAQEIKTAVEKSKVVSAVGYNWRAADITRKARERMAGK